jgi:hypothetical protein
MSEKEKKQPSSYLDVDSLRKDFKESLKKSNKEKYNKELNKKRRSEKIKAKVVEERKTPEQKETDRLKAETESMKAKMAYSKAEKEKAGETGEEAEARLLKELKDYRGKVATTGGKKLYKGDFPEIPPNPEDFPLYDTRDRDPNVPKQNVPEPTLRKMPFSSVQVSSDEGYKNAPKIRNKLYQESFEKEAYDKGYPGTPSRIAMDRMDKIKGDLKISKSAIDKGIPFNEAKKNKVVMDKYREYYKRFTIPGIDPRKRDHLAKISTQEWYNKAYAK